MGYLHKKERYGNYEECGKVFDEYGIGYSIEYWNNGDMMKVSIKVKKEDIKKIELELGE